MSVPEAIMHVDKEETFFSESVETADYDALGIGPGLGMQEGAAIAFISQVRRAQIPVVVDADG